MSEAGHFEVLLVGPGLSGKHVIKIADELRRNSFTIHEQSWLYEPAAVRLRCAREEAVDDSLRKQLMDFAEALELDAFVLDGERRRPKLFVFDMDSTLIQAEIIDELAGLAGVKDRVSAITERAMRGEINFRGALEERLRLLKGFPERRLQELLENVSLSEGVERLMRGLHDANVKTAIVSGGFGFFARHLKDRLGFDHLTRNELEIENGLLTGRPGAEMVDATRKAASLKEAANKERVALEEVVAVGDGANDLPMMQLAGIGVAYRAKPVVKASAQFRITFSHLDSLLHLL